MASIAKLFVIGNVGGNPETRQVGDTSVTSFSVATSEKVKGVEVTTWIRVSAWGKLGEIVTKFVRKGSQISVVGNMRQNSFTKTDGTQGFSIELRADDVTLLGKREDGDNDGAQGDTDSAGEGEIPF